MAAAGNSSLHSTPGVVSPMGSPTRSYLGHHSRNSSASTRFSGKLGRKGHPDWTQFEAIEEEEIFLIDAGDDERTRGCRTRCWFVGFVVAFFVLFSFFSLVLWGASRNHRPIITIKSVEFESFDVQAGMDYTGVAMAMASLNATVKLVYRNTGTFFGVHVNSSPLQLLYHDLIPIASGTIDNFYERRKSEREITVRAMGSGVPLYGAGYTLSSKNGAPISPVPITISLMLRSRAFVLGKLVKPMFYGSINCTAFMEPKKMNTVISLTRNCTYSS
ncbi:hypothetical protein Dimus_017162 [Dionaea muscipula]